MESAKEIIKNEMEKINSQKYTVLRGLKDNTQTREDVIKILKEFKDILERKNIQTDYIIEGIRVTITCVNHNFSRVRK